MEGKKERMPAKRNQWKIRISLVVMVAGVCIGMILTESAGMFYNVLLMPLIGALGYYSLRNKAYRVPLAVMIFGYLWKLIESAIEELFGGAPLLSVLAMPLTWAVLYSGFCALGVLIAFLLHVAFGKEENHE